MNCELEHNVPSQTKIENYNLGYTKEEISRYDQFSFEFLTQGTQPSSQEEPAFDQFISEEEAALAEGLNGLNFRETAHAFMSGNKVNQIVNIFEDSTHSSNSKCFKTSSFNSNSAEEQERRTNTLEPLNLPMELEVNIHHFTPVLQGEISTQVATPAPSDVSVTSESQNTRRRGRPAKVKLSMEEEIMKNDLNSIQQDFTPLKQQKNVRTTKTITKKNQLKLENKDEKFNRLSGFRNHISLVGKAVQTFTESDKDFRIQLKERLEGVELSTVAKYLTEKIKGRKNAKDQSKLANKMDVIDLLKVKEAGDSEAHKKRGAKAAFELFLDGEFYNIWLNAHYDKKWSSQGPKGENQRLAFVVLKDEIRKNFLEF